MKKVQIGIVFAIICMMLAPGIGSLDATYADNESLTLSETDLVSIESLVQSEIETHDVAVYVKSDSVLQNDPEHIQKFNDLLVNGNIIISESNEAMELIDDSISHVFNQNSSVSCIYYDPDQGTSHCLSITSDDPTTISNEIESWISTLDSTTSDVDVPDNFYVSCFYDDVKETSMGLSKIRTTYYYWDEDDPRYNYFFVYTQFDVTAKALPRMSNNVDYIHSECQLKYASSGDLTLQDTAPASAENSSISIGIGFPPSITIGWNIENDGLGVTNNSDLFSGKVDINQTYVAVLSTTDIHKQTSIGYSVLVDTTGPNQKTDYEATEKHTIGYKTHGMSTIVGTHTFEYDVHIIPGPSDSSEAVEKLQ